ncbi:MAG: hypothetical protein KY468_09050 [Armatimonadetes bacterium]|nr:hypothetical protein [Armatimonadota bacterium]
MLYRLLYYLTLKQFRHCPRCHQWRWSGGYTFVDERGRRVHDAFCQDCRIHGVPRLNH